MSPAENRLRNGLRRAMALLEAGDRRSFGWIDEMRSALRDINRGFVDLDDEQEATPTAPNRDLLRELASRVIQAEPEDDEGW